MRLRMCAVSLVAGLIVPGGLSPQAVPHRVAREVVRIGGIDAPAPAQFEHEPYLVASADGTLFARSSQPPSIAVFDPSGRYLRTIGRAGAGPGEFRSAYAHGLLGDTLWVINWPEARVSRFGVDGSHLSTDRLNLVDYGYRFSGPQSITALLGAGRAIAVPTAFPLGVEGRLRLPIYVGDIMMEERRIVAEHVTPQILSVRGVGVFGLSPFPIPPLLAVSHNGLGFVVADWSEARPGVLRLTRFDARGDQQWERTLQLGSESIPASVRDSLVAEGVRMAAGQIEAAITRGTIDRQSPETLVREGLAIPASFPPVDRMVLGVDGSIWVRRSGSSASARWLVLDVAGEPSFTMDLRPGFTVGAATSAWAWGTERGAFDVPFVVRVDVQ